jgi:hypothetical protein
MNSGIDGGGVVGVAIIIVGLCWLVMPFLLDSVARDARKMRRSIDLMVAQNDRLKADVWKIKRLLSVAHNVEFEDEKP